MLRRSKFVAGGFVEFVDDWWNYSQWALVGLRDARRGGKHLETQLILDYHKIEKGLTFGNPKRPFGKSMAGNLRSLLPIAESAGPNDAVWLRSAIDAQQALIKRNTSGEVDERVAPVRGVHGGVMDPEAFFQGRHSIRHYKEDDVDDDTLNRAVSFAIRAPSVCNRQPWRVRFLRGEQLARARRYQNGNRGIDPLPVLAVVTVDLQMFSGRGERNQAWIEGGIFSASLVYALHALGVDTCMLNMSVTNGVSRRFRQEFGIPKNEVVITMVAVGYGAESARVPRSMRREVSDVRF